MHAVRLQLIRLSEDRGIIVDGDRQFSVDAPASMPLVERVIGRLNQGDKPERIVSDLPISDRGSVIALLESLDIQQSAESMADSNNRLLLSPSSRVVLVGENAISAAAVRVLQGHACHEIIVAHDRVLDGIKARPNSDYAEVVDLPSGTVVVANVADAHLTDTDIVLTTCEYGRADRIEEICWLANEAEAVMIPAWLEGFTGHIGPITWPGTPGCLRCYALRRAANESRPELSEAMRRHATENPGGRGATGFVPPMTELLGALCAQNVLQVRNRGQATLITGRSIEIDLVRCLGTARKVLAVPGCPICGRSTSVRSHLGDATGILNAFDDDSRAGLLLDNWDRLVDSEVGIVTKVTPLAIDEDEPDFVHYLSTACSTDRLAQLKNFGNCGGVAVDFRAAAAKAVGEAVERYCSAFFSYGDLVLSSYQKLPGPGTHPDNYALYRPEQFAVENVPWRPFTVDAPICWTRGTSLCTGESVFVPAAMVYVPFHYLIDQGDTPICQPISTGLAAGFSLSDAALSGLCEVIERDAFTITWQARLSHPRVPVRTLPQHCHDRVMRFTEVGLRVEIMDITTDLGVPTILTVALGDRDTSPAVAVAAATHPQSDTAVNKSLEELAHTRKFARQVMDYTPPLPVDVQGGHPDVTEQQHHLRFYCPQPAKTFAEFAWAASRERSFGDILSATAEPGTSQLATVVDRVKAAGLDVIACDLTTPDIAELGLAVVRVVVPGLHPLFMGYRNRALGGHRLYEVPIRLGFAGIAPGEPDNPYPHPFP
jgi:ribosomal protein S12 methylthiotransferase accessory factor